MKKTNKTVCMPLYLGQIWLVVVNKKETLTLWHHQCQQVCYLPGKAHTESLSEALIVHHQTCVPLIVYTA